MNGLKHIAGVVVGFIAGVATYVVCCLLVGIMDLIPLIRNLLLWPADGSWLLFVLPPSAAAFAASWGSRMIAKTGKPTMFFLATFWVVNFITTIDSPNFAWSQVVLSVVGIASCVVCIYEE